jgi:hypothetical protein
MPYTADSIPKSHGEFSGGPGLIDPVTRADRVALTPDELRMEVMFTNPDPKEVAHGDTDEAMAARAAQIELENDPTKVPLPRLVVTE